MVSSGKEGPVSVEKSSFGATTRDRNSFGETNGSNSRHVSKCYLISHTVMPSSSILCHSAVDCAIGSETGVDDTSLKFADTNESNVRAWVGSWSH